MRRGVLFVLFLSGCAAPRAVTYLHADCSGVDRKTYVEERTSLVPWIDCAAEAGKQGDHATALLWLLILTPMACVVQDKDTGVVVMILPPGGAFRDHEYAHLSGATHAPVPFVEPRC